jgi:hypothetical protein
MCLRHLSMRQRIALVDDHCKVFWDIEYFRTDRPWPVEIDDGGLRVKGRRSTLVSGAKGSPASQGTTRRGRFMLPPTGWRKVTARDDAPIRARYTGQTPWHIWSHARMRATL